MIPFFLVNTYLLLTNFFFTFFFYFLFGKGLKKNTSIKHLAIDKGFKGGKSDKKTRKTAIDNLISFIRWVTLWEFRESNFIFFCFFFQKFRFFFLFFLKHNPNTRITFPARLWTERCCLWLNLCFEFQYLVSQSSYIFFFCSLKTTF